MPEIRLPPEQDTPDKRRAHTEKLFSVRTADLEPYVGLTYLSQLFRFMAVLVVLLLVSEIFAGGVTEGLASLPVLLGEASRLIVLAGLLWGAGDVALLFIDMGHDLRATRVLFARSALRRRRGEAPGDNPDTSGYDEEILLSSSMGLPTPKPSRPGAI